MNFYRNISYKMTDSQKNSLDLKAKDQVSNRNFIVPTYSAPLLGSEPGEQGTAFKARPIKHWRKQLTPRLDANGNALSGVNGRQAGIVGYMGVPGSTSILGTDPNNPNSCSSAPLPCTKSSTVLSDNILRPVDDQIYGTSADKIYDSLNNRTVCIACNPQNNVIKPATTILSKTYYSDRKAYLQSRCLLYDQRLSGNRLAGVTYFDNNGNELLPDETNDVEQRAAENCLSCGTAATAIAPIVYKPSNAQYATQGAVDSSSRIARLKYNTINKNNSMTAPFGSAGANANALYNGSGETPYFLKSKNNNAPCTFTRKGSKTSTCFKAI